VISDRIVAYHADAVVIEAALRFLFDLDSSVLDHLAPLAHLAAHEGGEVLRLLAARPCRGAARLPDLLSASTRVISCCSRR
jgi:hypothetical protein